MPSVTAKSLRDLRWQVVWYGLGLAAMAALVVYVYPSYQEQLAEFEIPEALRALIGDADYGTPQGFLAAEFFSWVPLIILVFAIMAGTSALAGEEANGTLELLLSQPISRTRLAVEKIAAIFLATAAIVGVTCLGWLVSVPFVAIEIDGIDLLAATLNVAPITLTFAYLAMLAGAVAPDRRIATGVVTAVAVLGFFVNYLAELVDVLAPAAWLSPFHYYDQSLISGGFEAWKLGVLACLSLAFALGTVLAFRQRDIGVRELNLRLALTSRVRAG